MVGKAIYLVAMVYYAERSYDLPHIDLLTLLFGTGFLVSAKYKKDVDGGVQTLLKLGRGNIPFFMQKLLIRPMRSLKHKLGR